MAYSETHKTKLINKICDLISKGMSRNEACEKEKLYPSTFREWIKKDESKSIQYARAIEDRANFLFEEIITIADSQENDKMDIDGVIITNHNAINRNRLQVDARKWVLSKMMPRKYGDKQAIEHSGEINTDLSKFSTEELVQRAKATHTINEKK